MSEAKRPILRELVGELLGSGVLVLVAFASGAVRAQFGTGTMAGALLGSVALGLGYGLTLWSFGSLSGAQTNPLVSVVASLLGGQPWLRTFAQIAAQVIGAGAVGLVIAKAAPFTIVHGTALTVSPLLAEAVAAFGFMLVALGVASRRNVKVPLALGAFATASFWMTGRATIGNPLIAAAVLLVTSRGAWEVLTVLGAETIGAGLALVVARSLFPQVREAATHLLFVPRSSP